MKGDNILPYDGEAVLIDDSGSDFDWPAVTRTLIETMPWQVETARIFGREMPVPRMTAWFGDAAYAYSGVCHQPAPFPAIIQRLRERAEVLSGASFLARPIRFYSVSSAFLRFGAPKFSGDSQSRTMSDIPQVAHPLGGRGTASFAGVRSLIANDPRNRTDVRFWG